MTYVKLILSCLLLCLFWAGLTVYGGFSGWWLEPIAQRSDTGAFMDAAQAMIDESSPGSVALIMIEDGLVYGEYYRSVSNSVDADTLFPAASFSKWPTAYGVMLLVQEGKLDLDAPVSQYLNRWHLPPSNFDNEAVTVRRLLSHTAGLVDGLGFGDYGAEETLPTLEQSLANPGSSDGEDVRIVVGIEPGSEWEYSGGGYLILELLVEEVSGLDFASYMQQAVFDPLGMTRSTYNYLGDQKNISGSYDRKGAPAPVYRYAAKGATALSSTASDLTRFVQAQLNQAAPLGLERVSEMREPHGYMYGMAIWGLGNILYSRSGDGDYVFGHDGSNDPSINSSVRINPESGDAIVALSTGPAYLASKIAYEWGLWQTGFPDFIQASRSIDSAKKPLLYGLLIIALITTAFMIRSWRNSGKSA